jgi:hypothetical protein
MKKIIDIVLLKVAIFSGKLNPEKINRLIETAEMDERINLYGTEILWYFDNIANEQDIFIVVQKACKKFNINFVGLSQSSFFSILKTIKKQNETIAGIIQGIQYPELTEIQKEAGFGSRHFGIAGMICNIAEAFNLSYLEAEKQPVISLVKLQMNAYLATCQENERKIKEMYKKTT